MKTQNTEVRSQKSEAPQTYLRAHNVGSVIDFRRAGMARHDARAERRFFKQHLPIYQVDGFVRPVLLVIVALAAAVIVLSAMLATVMGENIRLRNNLAIEQRLSETSMRDYANKPAQTDTPSLGVSAVKAEGGAK